MEDVEAINNDYWQYINPMIIDKDSELFESPLSQEVFDRISVSPNYCCLIDILEENSKEQTLDKSVSRKMKI